MRTFLYPAILTPDTEHGGFVVTFPDVPEGITQGDDIPEALKQAADCLDEAVAGRIRRHEPIPEASAVGPDQYAISLPISTGLKAALYLALQQAKITQSELAAHLHCDEQEVTRLLDPRRTANLSRLELALKALGYQLVLEMQAMIIPPCSVPLGGEGKRDSSVRLAARGTGADALKPNLDHHLGRETVFTLHRLPAIFRTLSAMYARSSGGSRISASLPRDSAYQARSKSSSGTAMVPLLM